MRDSKNIMKTSFQRFFCLNLRRAVTSDQVCQGGMRVKCARHDKRMNE